MNILRCELINADRIHADLALLAADNFARRRADLDLAEQKIRLARQIDRLGPFIGGYRHAVGNPSAGSPVLAGVWGGVMHRVGLTPCLGRA